MSDEPKLNSPERYVKRSPRLVLEEHSHCEVPAGCGGVVLRWINADREVPIRLRLYAHAPGAELTIDGARPASSRPLLPRGDHVLAIKATAVKGVGVFIASARFEEKGYDRKVSRETGLEFACDSRADGEWLATTEAPPDGRWRDDPYDDGAWTPLVEVPIPRPPERDGRAWHFDEILRAGAVALGLPDVEGDVWVRRRFRIPLVGEPGGRRVNGDAEPGDFDWILRVEALERPWRELMEAGLTLEATGDLRLAASAYDLAFGAAPREPAVVEARRRVLDQLAVTEHGLRFRYVPAGPFLMGNDEGEPDERPAHPAELDGFWIADVPITWAAYARLMGWVPPPEAAPDEAELARAGQDAAFALYEENKIRMQYCETGTTGARDWHAHLDIDAGSEMRELFPEPPRADEEAPESYDEKPMVAVGWHDAEALAERLSTADVHYWLPSEAEWEKAARGGLRGSLYPWGDALPTAERCDFGRFHRVSIVAPRAFAPNAYGLHGMVGGVWEWTHDWYDAEHYAGASVANPEGPAEGAQKALRGGSWADCEDVCTVSFRMGLRPASWRNGAWGAHVTPNVGFRLARHDTRPHGVERP